MMNLSYVRRAVYGVSPKTLARAVLRRAGALLGRKPPAAPTGADPIDGELQIETEGFWSWRALRNGTPNDAYNAGYLPVDVRIARHLLSLVTPAERFTFFDAGCGKGRALCLATEFGFRRIVGIEINPKIAEIAQRNARGMHTRFPSRVPIEVVVADASKVDFPVDPLVVFLYRPFLGPVLKAFSERLAQSLADTPRELYLFYVNPLDSSHFDAIPQLVRMDKGMGADSNYDAWRTRPSPTS